MRHGNCEGEERCAREDVKDHRGKGLLFEPQTEHDGEWNTDDVAQVHIRLEVSPLSPQHVCGEWIEYGADKGNLHHEGEQSHEVGWPFPDPHLEKKWECHPAHDVRDPVQTRDKCVIEKERTKGT